MLAISPLVIPILIVLSLPILFVGGAYAFAKGLTGGLEKSMDYGRAQRRVKIKGPKDGPFMIQIIDTESDSVLEWESWDGSFEDGWLRAMEMYEDDEVTRGPPNPYG